MLKYSGKNKPLLEQIKVLEKIIFMNRKIKLILEVLDKAKIENYYVTGGCINQTVFNYYHNYDLEYGIKDIDIVYFDEDRSYEKEDIIIKEISNLFHENIKLDIKNEARVHIWFKEKYGLDIVPYESVEDAVNKWCTTVTCIGIRLNKNNLVVYAPYGLNDLFEMVIRPVKLCFDEKRYIEKTDIWKSKWPKLEVIPWNK